MILDYTTVSRVINENGKLESGFSNLEPCAAQSAFVYDMNCDDDYLSNGSYTSRQASNSNYYHEYLQIDGLRSEKTDYSPSLKQEKKSNASVVRF